MLLIHFLLLLSFLMYVSTDKTVKTKSVIILIDGFRYDYVKTIPNLSGFKDIIANGVTTEYVTPIFPSTSYPNYYTITTGLFAESHGFVGNNMYDRPTNTSFITGHNPESDHLPWWDGAEPVWITAERQGVKTALYYWPGCHIKFPEIKPYYCQPYSKKALNISEIEAAMDDTISKLKRNDIQISFIYYESVDKMGHFYGPFSAELNRTVEELDNLLRKFRLKLKENKLEDSINLLLISDHGMAPISIDKRVNLYEYADIKSNSDAVFPEISIAAIYPKKDQVNKLYKELEKIKEHAKVYQKEDFPSEWHFKYNKRTPELFVLADEGYFLLLDESSLDQIFGGSNISQHHRLQGGMHGYDNKLPSMRSFFAAVGPDFKQGYLNAPIFEVDVYNIMCRIMNLEPLPNNGTWNNVKNMLIMNAEPLPNNGTSNGAFLNRCHTMWISFISTIITLTQLMPPFLQSL